MDRESGAETAADDRESRLEKACTDLSASCRMECEELGTRWCPAVERAADGR